MRFKLVTKTITLKDVQDIVEKLEIENKLILSMAIRLKAELYMKDKILNDLPNGNDIMNDIYSKKNQSVYSVYFIENGFAD